MTRFPNAAVLGPFTYRITDAKGDWKKLDKDTRDNCWGYTKHATATIYVQPDVEPVLKRVTLLHELLHAAAFAGGVLDMRKRPEESWVAMVSPQLMDALSRTPGLAAYLFEVD